MKKENNKDERKKETTAKSTDEKKVNRSGVNKEASVSKSGADHPAEQVEEKAVEDKNAKKTPDREIRSAYYQHPDDPTKKRIQFTLFQKNSDHEDIAEQQFETDNTNIDELLEKDSPPSETSSDASEPLTESDGADSVFAQKVHSFHVYDKMKEVSQKEDVTSNRIAGDADTVRTSNAEAMNSTSASSAMPKPESNQNSSLEFPGTEPKRSSECLSETNYSETDQFTMAENQVETLPEKPADGFASQDKTGTREVATTSDVKTKTHNVQIDKKEVKTKSRGWFWKLSGRLLPVALGALLAGLGIGGSVAYYWYSNFQGYQSKLDATEQQVKSLERDKQVLSNQLEDSYLQLQNLQVGLNQMNKLFATISDPPGKPRYQLAGDAVVLYWLDGMLWRRYYIYEARGKNGRFKKLNKRSTKKTYMYLDKLKKGTYRYAITALDREGTETEMSEYLEIKIKH